MTFDPAGANLVEPHPESFQTELSSASAQRDEAAACSFCDPEQREPQTLMETRSFSLLADRRPLRDGHVLIVPRQHVPCLGALPGDWDAEFLALKEDAQTFVEQTYGSPISFETCSGDQGHAHLHIVPNLQVDRDQLLGAPAVLAIKGISELRAWYAAHRPYLYYEDAQGALLAEPAVHGPGLRDLISSRFGADGGSPTESGDRAARRLRSEWQRHRRRLGDSASEVIACFLWRKGRVCLLKRSQRVDSAPGRWHIVAGYLPRGVEPMEHALTEVGEETSLRIAQVRLMARGEALTIGDPFAGMRWRIHPFLFEVLDGEVRLNWEHDDVTWVSPEDLAGYGTMPWLPQVFFSLQAASKRRL